MNNPIRPAVVIKSKFILASGSKNNFNNYLNYMDRKNTHSNENDFQNYQDYMSNEEKSTGLFTSSNDKLSEKEKEDLKSLFEQSQQKGSILWQDVISFDNEWLQENGVLKNGFMDEQKMKQATRNAVNEMIKKEGLSDSAIWSAAIHYNTDNIHVHVATVQTKNFRDRGKRKQKSIDSMKSKVASTILDRSKENEKLNEFIREKVVKTKRDDDLLSLKNRVVNRDMVKQFKKIHSMLPEDKRLWAYSMNGIKNVRPEIDKLTDMYIQRHFKNEFKEFEKQLGKKVQLYKRIYGDTKKAEQYKETKMDDLYKRMGNTILKEVKKYDYELKSAARSEPKNKFEKIKRERAINNFIYTIDRGMNDDLQHWKNQREFERMQQEKEHER
ncbi:MobP2 family relaxase [Domibacillus sp. DTU_2020_1001157_1_SI_ALB_TIR_016]|uniref:MobP2 family relaxase n=1 Tax=Domibacillus sp. DTU_2020_1001157_1_SI_ALB_TIR_016 TaxID=3077789 RepID=UPI0028E7DD99|nr:MobP2 family relaxase [Domibacillus sp. DTU_2020_1001157_1_SI_ALB_TIR_016]WNS78825.1 MobP2 family relaxase [Domibacillus sp. DTU_2020_1001157_1_SI_ALB_TIR_016]